MARQGLPSLGLSLPPLKNPQLLGLREVTPLPRRAQASSVGTSLVRSPTESRVRASAQMAGPRPNQALINRGSAINSPRGSQIPAATPMAMPQAPQPMMMPTTGTPAQPMPPGSMQSPFNSATRPVNGGGYYHQLRGAVLDHLQALR